MSIKSKIKGCIPISIKQNLKSMLIKMLMQKEWRKKNSSKIVLFESFDGRQYSDNPKRISEVLHELYPEYSQVWAMKLPISNELAIPDYVNVIDRYSVDFYRTLATCFCYIRNTHFENDIYKNQGKQFFIQTWHGDIGFKKVLYDANPDWRNTDKVLDSKLVDLCISASDYGAQQYRSAFGYEGEILNVGTPRNDRLVNVNYDDILRIKKKIGIRSDQKVLIYAPTFRDNSVDNFKVNVNLQEVLDILERKGESWVCLLRAHANSSGLDVEYDNRFIDVSKYPDMADLLLIGDLLITDYSSCAGDFIRKNKGAILAVFDKDEYEKECREIPFDLVQAGFIVARNKKELNDIILNMSEADFIENCQKIIQHFHIIETGNSAEIICHRIDSFYKSLR